MTLRVIVMIEARTAVGVTTSAPLARETLENWERMLAVNATSAFLCLRAFVPGLMGLDTTEAQTRWLRRTNIGS